MEVDEPMNMSQGNSRTSSRNSSRRSPMMPPPSGHGVTLNRPLGSSGQGMNIFSSLPRGNQVRDYSCPPPSRSSFGNRRSSSGMFITSMFGSRFRHLQKLHSDAFCLGLNAVCFPGLPVGTMFRSSLPATPVSTPIHREAFTQFTEEALRDRLCKTPSPRKVVALGRGYSPLDLTRNEDNFSETRDSRSSEIPMEMSCPTTPIPEEEDVT